MKVRFNRWYNAVLTALLTILGYSCEGAEEYGVPDVEEYGCPSADFVIKGQVTDEAGTPVQGIKTSLKQIYKSGESSHVYGMDSVQTNVSGSYQLKYNGMEDESLKVIVEDIDGEANGGEFLSDTLDIDYNKAVQTKKGDGHWYAGVFEIAQDVKLKKK